jgi:hypothetical protein
MQYKVSLIRLRRVRAEEFIFGIRKWTICKYGFESLTKTSPPMSSSPGWPAPEIVQVVFSTKWVEYGGAFGHIHSKPSILKISTPSLSAL